MFASFHAFYRVDVVIHMLSACIDVVIHIALCMHRCGHPHGNAMLMWSSTCAYKFAFCFAPCIQVDKTEIASQLEAVGSWLQGLATHQSGLKTWKDLKKGLVN